MPSLDLARQASMRRAGRRPGLKRLRAGCRKLLALAVLLPLASLLHDAAQRERIATDDDRRAAIEQALRAALKSSDVEARLAAHLAAGEVDAASLLIDAADLAGLPIALSMRAEVAAQSGGLPGALATVRGCARGVFSGSAAFAGGEAAKSEFTCAIGSDLLVVGDIRDLGRQASFAVSGAPVDPVLVGLSVAGIALTVASPALLGTNLLAKTGLAVLKTGIRSGAVAAPLRRQVAHIIGEAVDQAALARLARPGAPGLSGLPTALRGAVDTARLAPLAAAGRALAAAWRASDAKSVALAVRSARSIDDIAAAPRVARFFGPRSAAVYEVLGPAAFRLARLTLRWTTKAVVFFGGFVVSLFGAVVAGVAALKIALALAGFVLFPVRWLAGKAFGNLWRAIYARRPAAKDVIRWRAAPFCPSC